MSASFIPFLTPSASNRLLCFISHLSLLPLLKWYRNAEAHVNVRPEFEELRLDGSWESCFNAFEEIMWVSAFKGVSDSGLWAWDILAFLTSNFSAADTTFIWKCECLGPLRASCVHSVKYSSIFSVFLSMQLCNYLLLVFNALSSSYLGVGRKPSHETWSFVPSCI